MRFGATCLVASTLTALAACSSSSTTDGTGAQDASSDAVSPVDAVARSDAGGATDAAAADANASCGRGSTVAADWSFSVSAASLNASKGQVLTVKRCDSVVWTNTDSAAHSVASTGGGFEFHTPVNTGGAYPPIQFTRAGTFTYDCGIHGNMMVGEITVQ